LTAVGILDDKKRNIVMPGHDRVEVPIIEKKSAQILSVSGKTAKVMDTETFETLDMDIPEELASQVKEGVEVLYWQIMGQKVMKQVK
jgi:translation initiation factor 5A